MTGNAVPVAKPATTSDAARIGLRILLIFGMAALGSAASADTDDDVADVFSGIVRYSQWPDAPATLRICVNEQDRAALLAITRRFSEEAASAPAGGALVSGNPGPVRVQVVSRAIDVGGIAALLECHAIYFGDPMVMARRPTVMAMVARLINLPILTVGHGEDFCSWGGLFCLSPSEAGWRIRANLDSISRSGLRVNAQLLRLTQRERGQS
ncbi:hypothetical protein BH11PSE8_BH11PSE8_36800 [soil metagenome]